MSDHDARLHDLASRLADGREVDWDEAERGVDDQEQREVVRRLRLLDSLARVHRSDDQATLPFAAYSSSGEPERSDANTTAITETRAEAWGHLELRERLGEGAFGVVYRAWDPRLERDVALKLLKSESGEPGRDVRDALREGRLMARLCHPNLVAVHGVERHGERVGTWMELIRGRTLEEVSRTEGKLGGPEAALIGLDVCRALAAIHGAGMIHGDVKSRNVMREQGGRILLMDFGAGRDLKRIEDRKVSGTPLYMAPELFLGQPATPRSDLYSVGVLLYHLVTASFPVEAETVSGLRRKHRRREVRQLRDERPDLSEAFVRVVERALARDPAERFATAGQMERSLSAALGTESGPQLHASANGNGLSRRERPRWLWALAVSAGAVTLVLAAWLVLGVLESTPVASRSADPAPAGETLVSGVYDVGATLYRSGEGRRRQRLSSGDRLELGDRLNLEFEASRDMHVYVVNEDEQGHAYALFPMPHLDLQNPLPAGRTHLLPGRQEGEQISWVVDSPGGREHLLVVASPKRLVEFEAELDSLATPRPGQSALVLSEKAKIHLRGIGGLAKAPVEERTGPAQSLFELAERLASRPEKTSGVWLRQIELENPRP